MQLLASSVRSQNTACLWFSLGYFFDVQHVLCRCGFCTVIGFNDDHGARHVRLRWRPRFCLPTPSGCHAPVHGFHGGDIECLIDVAAMLDDDVLDGVQDALTLRKAHEAELDADGGWTPRPPRSPRPSARRNPTAPSRT